MLKKEICPTVASALTSTDSSAPTRTRRDIELTSHFSPRTNPTNQSNLVESVDQSRNSRNLSYATNTSTITTTSETTESTSHSSTSETQTSSHQENNCASPAIFFRENKFFGSMYDEQTENLKKDMLCEARKKMNRLILGSHNFNDTIKLCDPAIRGWYFSLSVSIFGIPPVLHTTWTLKAILSLYSVKIYQYNHQFLETNCGTQTVIVILALIGIPFIFFTSLFFRSGR